MIARIGQGKTKWASCSLLFILMAGIVFLGPGSRKQSQRLSLASIKKADFSSDREAPAAEKFENPIERMEYDFGRLVDPKTGEIPANMRARELAFASNLPTREMMLGKGGAQLLSTAWTPRGPINVGGRTRALAVDLNYNGAANRRLLAGGVSGGMFLSEDDGATWKLTTSFASLASVTCLAQDPNNRNVWYYGTGELTGTAEYPPNLSHLGQGIFKSMDGGNTWTQLSSTKQGNKPTMFDHFFDYLWSIAVHPQNSAVYAATFGAILRSTDGGDTWQQLLGRAWTQPPHSEYSDVAIAPDGSVYATLSRNGGGFPEYGVFHSTNNGNSWSAITPPALAQDPHRMLLGVAPSDPNTVYLLLQANENGATAQDHQLFRYHAGTNTWTDLSSRLPDPPGPAGTFDSQQGYNLLVKVKPDNPNVVWIGGTNLHRSTDGGQTFSLVGGFLSPQTFEPYPNHHSDQHALAFYPNNPNAVISGHDGGLSKTTNALQSPQQWTSLNNGYLTTLFYTVAIDPQPGNEFLVGGLQDNGTWGTDAGNYDTPWFELTGGDGAYGAIAPGGWPFFVSSQNARTHRVSLSNGQASWSLITPAGAEGFLFINPFVLDPNDARVMYMVAGDAVWRNSNLDEIPEGNTQATAINWSALSASATGGIRVKTLAVSQTPANRLYFGASNTSTTLLVRVDNAAANPPGVNITPAGVAAGSYPSAIALNPNNADEILATFTNYNVPSVFYSANGGASWTNVEGNLGGEDGPSVRWATIVPGNSGKVYLLATSTGVYSTMTLNGANTTWVQEGSSTIGNVTVDMIVSRAADGLVAAGTHGRGVYSTKLGGGGAAVLNVDTQEIAMQAKPGQTGEASLTISNTGGADLSFNITASGGQPEASVRSASGERARLSMVNAPLERVLPAPSKRVSFGRSLFQNEDQASAKAYPSRTTAEEGALGNKTSSSKLHAPPTPAFALVQPSALRGNDVLVLDDGNDTQDDFIGEGPNSFNSFYWMNQFDLAQDFKLEGLQFYMQTEALGSNTVEIALMDDQRNDLVRGSLSLNLAQNGGWFTVTLTSPVQFKAGETFHLELGADYKIAYPAGADKQAQVPNRSYHYNWDLNTYEAIGAVTGFADGAYMLRALGTKSGGNTNQPPAAKAQISKSQAVVNEAITFDASQSSDADGQITQYSWDFGDNNSSNQKIATHAYAQAGNYLVKLTVTDDKGATGQAVGLVTISPGATSRLAVNPTNGTLAPGGRRTINVTFDAEGLAEGDYQGQINITSNGGNRTLPVHINVSNSSTATVELAYDNGTHTETYVWPQAGQGSAVRFTPPALPAKVKEAKIFIGSIQNGSKHKLRVLADANGSPGATILGPLEITLPGGGWIHYDLSAANLTVNDDFYVMIEYDGANKPSFGSENVAPLEKRSWDFDGANWTLYGAEDYLIRAIVEYTRTGVGEREQNTALPQAFELSQNYPNPFNPETTIAYRLPQAASVELAVYDLSGRRVATIATGMKAAGAHAARWNGRDGAGNRVASGVYFYRLEATSPGGTANILTKKMTVMK